MIRPRPRAGETRFRVRETPEWKKHAADLEAEMIKRGMTFEVIDWSEDQATLPFEEDTFDLPRMQPAPLHAGFSFHDPVGFWRACEATRPPGFIHRSLCPMSGNGPSSGGIGGTVPLGAS